MANTTTLADLKIVPEIFTRNVMLRTLETNAFSKAGVTERSAELDAFLSGPVGGKKISPRFYAPLTQDDPNISTDDPATLSVPKKISALTNSAVRQSLNQSWSVMDLAADLNGDDPQSAIEAQIGDYWAGVLQRRILSSARGAVTGNADMVLDITSGSGAAALFNADAFIDAQGTMGDRYTDLRAIAVHSHVLFTMKKLDLIEYEKDSQGALTIPYYQGLRVIVDDGMTVISGDKNKYISYLFGNGAIALGMGTPKVPFETKRNPDAGNGGGEELLYSRQEWIIHPQGFSYGLDTTPSIAELENTANWTRAFERKRVPLAALITL